MYSGVSLLAVAQTIAKVPFTPGHEMVGEVSIRLQHMADCKRGRLWNETREQLIISLSLSLCDADSGSGG